MLTTVPRKLSKLSLLLLFLGITLCGELYGQADGRSVSELWNTFQQSNNDSIQTEALVALASSYVNGKLDSAFILGEAALERAQKGGFRSLEAGALISLGEAYDVSGQIQPALANINEGLDIATSLRDQKGIGRAHNSRGLALFYANQDLKQARDDFKKAQSIAEERGDLARLAKIYHNLGQTHQGLEELPEALGAYLRARNLKDSLVAIDYPGISVRDQISTYNNLSVFYQSVFQFDEARNTILEALDIIPEQQIGRRAVLLLKLGIIEEQDSNYNAALTYLNESLELAQEGGFLPYLPNIHNAIGNAHLELESMEAASDNYDLALKILEELGADMPDVEAGVIVDQAMMFFRQNRILEAKGKATETLGIIESTGKVGSKKLLQAHHILAQIAELQNDNAAARVHWREYAKTQGKILNEDHSQEYIGLRSMHDVAMNTTRYELALKEQELEISEKWIYWLQIAVAAALLLALAFAYAKTMETRANRQLQDTNVLLEELNVKQADTNQKLSLANNKIQQFAFATGHDLKESLRNITSFTQLASIEMAENTGQAQSHLQEAAAGGKRMRKMLDDLLHYSNIGGNDTSISKMSLDEVIGSVKQQLKSEIEDVRGDVHLITPATLNANRTEVEQIFFNLVHNALRYAKPDTEPRVRIEVVERDGELAFQVKDNGMGIAEEHRIEIFKPFFRLHNRMTSGSGLGLSICKNIVENYDGRIWHEAAETGGSIFYFTLPKAEVKAQIAASA